MSLLPLDQRDGFLWQDGRMVENRAAQLHVLTHGLHYASSVFEGLRAYGGKIFKLEAHIDRLFASARLLDLAPRVTKDEMMQGCLDVLAANNLKDAYLRPLFWRGSEQLGVGGTLTTTHAAIAAWQWTHSFSDDVARDGITLVTARWRRPPPECTPVQAKAAGNYMISTLSKRAAEQAGAHDALLLDWRGQIAEASAANIFLVIDGALHTPVADCFLNGITRQAVIGLARDLGIPVVERALMPEALAQAQEVFLTGTAYEIMPVARIDGFSFQPGAVTAQLRDAYHRLAGK